MDLWIEQVLRQLSRVIPLADTCQHCRDLRSAADEIEQRGLATSLRQLSGTNDSRNAFTFQMPSRSEKRALGIGASDELHANGHPACGHHGNDDDR
jgi:hypothetical protein